MPTHDRDLPTRVALRASLERLQGLVRTSKRFQSILVPKVLKNAQTKAEGLPPGQVWAKDLNVISKAWSAIAGQWNDLAYDLGNVLPGQFQAKALDDLAYHITEVTSETSGTPRWNPNQKERLSYGFGKPLFHEGGVAYATDQWGAWQDAFGDWLSTLSTKAEAIARRA